MAVETPAKNGVAIEVPPGGDWKRRSQIRWKRIGDLKIAPHAQRDFLPHWANELAAKFSIENMGHVVVSHRPHGDFVIDGQHRLAALQIIGFAETDQVPCEVYEGLTDKQESELFLERNNNKTVAALARFARAVDAGRKLEVEIDDCVRAQGLRIGRSHLTAVRALRNVYQRVQTAGLNQTLRIIRDAYGEAGFKAIVIEAIGLVVQRYEGLLDEDRAIKALSSAKGGLNGLLTQANKTRAMIGQAQAQCIAATVVGFYNREAGRKLAAWWREDAQ